MYAVTYLTHSELDLSIMGLMVLEPSSSFYRSEKPPLVVHFNDAYYWMECESPSQTQDCLIQHVSSIQSVFEVMISYHHLHHAHAVIQALFIQRSRSFLSKDVHDTDVIIPFLVQKSSRLETQYRDISRLPHPLLCFMIEKNYSLKQCYYYCRFDASFLRDVLDWLFPLSPTASQFKLCCASLYDLTRRRQISVSQIKEMIMCQKGSETISEIMKTLRYHQSPSLTQINHEMTMIRDQYNIPVTWDSTLEKQELQLMTPLRTVSDFELFKAWVNRPGSLEGVRKLLDFL